VHQLVATAAPMDAVTDQAFAWQELLRRWGLPSTVFAEQIHPQLTRAVRPLREFVPRRDAGVVLHYSIWSRSVELALATPPDRLAMNYQNITPSEFLRDVNPDVAELCDRGRRGLRLFAGRVAAPIAASRFNASEIEDVGLTDVRIVPLILRVPPPPPARPEVAPTIVTVGRVVPNKRLEDAIRAVAILRRHLLPAARFEIVGAWDGFERYHDALQGFVDRLGVGDAVTFTGRLSDAARDAIYARAGAYLCVSEHEGFCAPLIEALSHGLPVVARAAAAVPETLGGAGLLLPDGDARLAAESLHEVLTSFELRQELERRARHRLAELAPDRVEKLLRQALTPILS